MRMTCVVAVCLALVSGIVAQPIDFPKEAFEDEAALAAAMPALAERLIATSSEDDLFRLQLVAGRYADASKTLGALPPSAANVRWEIYAKAKSLEAGGTPFDAAFQQSFRETMRALDDQTAYRVLWSFGTSPNVLRNALRDTLSRHKGASTLSTADALDLARKYLGVEAYGRFASLIPALSEEDDRRRYVIEKDVLVKGVCTIVVRPRVGDRKLPALLNFTIYADPDNTFNEARRTASNGYVGVVGLTRGKGCSPGKAVPYEHDGADAATLIDWIAAQPWSDGRVGMYGGSYEGSTAWAAAKRMPKALKGIMTGAPVAPGIEVPMEGNVFWSFVYPWPFYTTNNKTSTTPPTTTTRAGSASIASGTQRAAPIATWSPSTARPIRSSTAGWPTPATMPTGAA